ncbi:trihelix transcription factor ASIL2-like [Zingiber officinale]|uniref:Myb/SANT-like DNA-binding domain-containing protein n=1 Tax=Zingiber officinale TaxID=94328 RepID=A0A8J5FAX0_ZINOF|nr:trihelix transcription factor ASIL2-like [Zingiber officinale]KAG6483854.1 hypothetical protein ZIOFF_060640 [Zingiber officinale]
MAAAPNSSQNHPPSPTEPGSPSLSPSSDRSPSPPPRPASLPPPPPASAPSASRRLAAPIWNHEETLALIEAYRGKWYALRRGNLRAPHWEEVADDVARRCPSGLSPPKTAVQCRHKVEKLRKRYRGEMQKSLRLDPSLAPVSSWVYFPMMDAMEVGGGGGPRRPFAFPSFAAPPPPSDDDDEELEEDNNDDDDFDGRRGAGGWGSRRSAQRQMANGRGGIGELTFSIPKAVRSKISRTEDRSASNYIMSPNPTTRFFKGYSGSSGQPSMGEMRRSLEKKRRRVETEQSAVSDMVAAVRMLGDGFLRMEQRKMEMAREMEKVRMEMEMQRTELILDSQRRILDAFLKGFSAKKRAKVLPED